MPDLVIRPAVAGDLPAVAQLYAWYVANSVVTFDLEAKSLEGWQERLADLSRRGLPFLVGRVDDELVGYAYVAPWRDRAAYRLTVENSVYLAPEHTGRGHGRRLLTALLDATRAAGAREVVAVISDSDASVGLHRSVGFRDAGRLTQVGFKHGRWLDVVLLQLSLAREGWPS